MHEELSYLEGIYQSDKTEESAGSRILSANVYIQPSDDVLGESDKDFGDEEAP